MYRLHLLSNEKMQKVINFCGSTCYEKKFKKIIKSKIKHKFIQLNMMKNISSMMCSRIHKIKVKKRYNQIKKKI